MSKKIINIDGWIGDYAYSSMYVKALLKDAGSDPVEIRINSLGGDVGHAISIKDALEAHGNVTALYSGMSASSATLLSMGCKKVQMTKDSLWLVHKPMIYVDAWGELNEDKLRQLIETLDSKLESAQKVTLQMAEVYARRTGQSMKDMLDLMKKEVWLNATEAKEWGFIDEIIEPAQITNFLEDQRLVALITGNGMPLPGDHEPVTPPVSRQSTDQVPVIDEEGLASRIFNRIKDLFPKSTEKQTQKSNIKMESISFVARVLNVETLESQDGYVTLSVEQINTLEAAMQNGETERQTAETNLTAANAARAAAEQSLTNALTALDEIDETVRKASDITAKVEAVRVKLAEKPAAAATGIQSKADDQGRLKVEGADEINAYVKKYL